LPPPCPPATTMSPSSYPLPHAPSPSACKTFSATLLSDDGTPTRELFRVLHRFRLVIAAVDFKGRNKFNADSEFVGLALTCDEIFHAYGSCDEMLAC
jgi:hypothetical protein